MFSEENAHVKVSRTRRKNKTIGRRGGEREEDKIKMKQVTSVSKLSSHTCVFTNLGLISTVLIDVLQFYIAYWYDRENSPVFKCS